MCRQQGAPIRRGNQDALQIGWETMGTFHYYKLACVRLLEGENVDGEARPQLTPIPVWLISLSHWSPSNLVLAPHRSKGRLTWTLPVCWHHRAPHTFLSSPSMHSITPHASSQRDSNLAKYSVQLLALWFLDVTQYFTGKGDTSAV